MNIEQIIEQMPGWKIGNIKYEPLSGGYSNKLFKVFTEDRIYALRINGEQNEHLNLKYTDEVEIIKLASEYGIAPGVPEYTNKLDYLITEFIDGQMISVKEMHNPELITEVISLLKKVHHLPYSGTRYSTVFSLTRGYMTGAEKLGLEIPTELNEQFTKMKFIEMEREKDPIYMKQYCHNDVFNHNLIRNSEGNIKLIDWELSGIGDIWFDLATLSFSCGFNEAEEEIMLLSYFGIYDDHKRKTLKDIKFACMIREIGWALLHTAINRNLPQPGNDYMDFAQNVLSRLNEGKFSLVD